MRVRDSYDSDTWQRIREPDHIRQVLAVIERNFPRYFASFWKPPKKRMRAIQAAIDTFLQRQEKYRGFLDLECLEEYEYDPASYKSGMRRELPIIRGALFSQDEAMKQYKKAFNLVNSADLLRVTKNIVMFAEGRMHDFDDELHELAESVDDMDRSTLEDEGYFAAGVIGEGIKSHFLYSLYPNAFPNRSQNAIWSLYFLTDAKDFGLQDYSEFLMVDEKKSITQQNYFYTYDLFCFYALKIYLMLEEACTRKEYPLTNGYRYVYLDHFFDYIAGVHRDDIRVFMINSEESERGFF